MRLVQRQRNSELCVPYTSSLACLEDERDLRKMNQQTSVIYTWNELKAMGWSFRSPDGMENRRYIRPGIPTKQKVGLTAGVDFFMDPSAASEYLASKAALSEGSKYSEDSEESEDSEDSEGSKDSDQNTQDDESPSLL